MTTITSLDPHDPLPDGPAIILMRRFEEDHPPHALMEGVVLGARQAGGARRLRPPDGPPMPWDDAERRVISDAEEAGIERLYRIDRTAGPREHEVETHGGDRTVNMEALDDFDLEEGERGTDMRDMPLNEAPRKF